MANLDEASVEAVSNCHLLVVSPDSESQERVYVDVTYVDSILVVINVVNLLSVKNQLTL